MRSRRWVRSLLVIAAVGAVGFGAAATAVADGAISGGDRVGLFDPDTANWYFADEAGALDSTVIFGNPGDIPLTGDWDCNGTPGLGVYRPADRTVHLRQTLTTGIADVSYTAGAADQVPIAGDFNGDGCDTVSFFNTSTGEVLIHNSHSATIDTQFFYGNPDDLPFVGDFDKDKIDTLTQQRRSTGQMFLRNSNSAGIADIEYFFGNPFDVAVAGQWTLGAADSVAIFRPADATFYFRFLNSSGNADVSFAFGESDWIPVSYTLNSPPIAVDDGYTTDEDTKLDVAATGVLANDTDPDGNTLNAALKTTTTNGTLALASDGSFTYTPNANFFGADTFTYTTSDGLATSGAATVTITVTAVNDVPTGTNQSYSTSEDTALNQAAPGVLSGASDVEGESMTAVQVSGPSNGALSLASDGSFTYAPNLNFNGSDSFTFAVSDGTGQSAPLTATITVTPVNDAPVAVDDDAGTGTFTTDEDTSFTTTSVLSNDTDVDTGDVVSVASLDTTGTKGLVTNNGDGTFGYDPNGQFEALPAGASDTDTFKYTANDVAGLTSTATVTITITGAEDAPMITGTVAGAVAEDGTLVATETLTATDADAPDTPTFTAQVATGSTYGSFDLTVGGVWTYSLNNTAAQALAGTDVVMELFPLQAMTGDGEVANATVTITITGAEDAPMITGTVAGAVAEDGTLVATDTLTATDADAPDTPTFTAQVATGSTYGSFDLTVGGVWTYSLNNTAAQALAGTDVVMELFPLQAMTGDGEVANATVTITITGAEDAPMITGTVAGAVAEDGTLVATETLTATDADAPDTPTFTAQVATGSTYGSFDLTVGGVWTYSLNNTAAQALAGTDVVMELFPLQAMTGDGEVANATVTITITGAEDAPMITGTVAGAVAEDGTLVATETLTATDADAPDTPTFTAQVATGSTYGSFDLTVGGVWTYSLNNTAAQALAGTDVVMELFPLQAMTGDGEVANATVTITITGDEDPPTADDDAYSFIGNTLLEVATAPTGFPATTEALGVLDGDVDPEGGLLTVTEVNGASGAIGTPTTLPSGAVLTMAADGSFTYLPKLGSIAGDSFVYTVADPEGGLDNGTVTMTALGTDIVWFIDSAGAPGGDGRSSLPFDSLTAFAGATTATGDTVYVHSGGPYNGGITLLDDQPLVGGGVSLVVGAKTLQTAGSNPVVSSPVAGGNAVTLAANNAVRGLNISSTNGTALGGTSVGGLVVSDVASLSATGGMGIDLDGGNVSMSVSISSVTTTAAPGGIRIVNSPGATSSFLNVPLGATSGTALELLNAGSVTINGTVANTGGQAINASGGTALTATFTSVSATNPAGDGIVLDGTTGTVNLSGLNITTTGGAAFRASNSGTLNVTGSSNTLSATGGIGLEVNNTTIGASGVTFQTISSSGGMTGITLNSTGASGGLTVTGDGGGTSNGSGGTITTATTDGISLTDTMDVSLTQLDITTTGDHAIDALRVTNLTYQDANIVGGGNADDEHAIKLLELHGTSLIEDVLLDDINEDGIELRNTVPGTGTDMTTIRRLTVEDHTATFFGEHGVDVQAAGAANLWVLIDDSTFTINANGSQGVLSHATDTAALTMLINGSRFHAAAAFGAGTIQTAWSGDSTGAASIIGNDINETAFNGITVLNDDNASLDVTITGNDFDFIGVGPNSGNGILLRQDTNGDAKALISANTIDGFGFDAIRVFSRDSTDGTGSVDATVTGNTTGTPTQFGAGLSVISRDMNSVCLNASGNTLSGTGTFSPLDDDLYLENDDVTPSSHGISQASLATLSTDNGGLVVGSAGTITFNQTCDLPAP